VLEPIDPSRIRRKNSRPLRRLRRVRVGYRRWRGEVLLEEREMRNLAERAWREGLRVSVWSEEEKEEERHGPLRVVVHDPPVGF